MAHIRQKTSPESIYTIVNSEGYGGEGQPPLDQHPAVVNHPNIFEVVDNELPEIYQVLNYVEM